MSQILIVRSPAPDANHLLSGSTARARTQPRWPDITRISFHGGCQSGFGCAVGRSDRRASCWPGVCCDVEEDGLLRERTRAFDVRPPPFAATTAAGMPSISFRVDSSGASSVVLGAAAFFFRGPAVGILEAMTSGRVRTSLYSELSRTDRAVLSRSGSDAARAGSSFMRLRPLADVLVVSMYIDLDLLAFCSSKVLRSESLDVLPPTCAAIVSAILMMQQSCVCRGPTVSVAV